MAYIKTEWKARQGVNLNKFNKSQETNDSVVLSNAPDEITEHGTPFSAENMNHIERGIADAHDWIETEVMERKRGDSSAMENMAKAIAAHDESAAAHSGLAGILAGASVAGLKIIDNPSAEQLKAALSLNNVTDDAQVKRSEVGKNGGVAALDASGKVPRSQIPDIVGTGSATQYTGLPFLGSVSGTAEPYVAYGVTDSGQNPQGTLLFPQNMKPVRDLFADAGNVRQLAGYLGSFCSGSFPYISVEGSLIQNLENAISILGSRISGYFPSISVEGSRIQNMPALANNIGSVIGSHIHSGITGGAISYSSGDIENLKQLLGI